MSKGSPELSGVQRPLTKYATQVGWIFVPPEEAVTLRNGESGLFLYPVLRAQLMALNPGTVTDSNVDEFIKRLENVKNSIEGNEELLQAIRGRWSVYLDEQGREVDVTLVDPNAEENTFHVTEEWSFTNGRFTTRSDVVFLINGIPVAIVETKAASKPDGIHEAFVQVRRYHDETPEMMTAPQIYDLTHLVNFFYAPTWNLDRRSLFNWKDEESGNFEKKVKAFFDRDRLVTVLGNYIVFSHKDDGLRKFILRQHQIRAVEKVTSRTLDKSKRRGLVWHTQGSGKTLTMITAARQILSRPEFSDVTVLMLIDRLELEDQLIKDLDALGMQNVEIATSKKRLRGLMGEREPGLIVSMIHKFDKMPAALNESEKVIVLVDEAHRSTGGDLGNYLMAALPNATYIGFTGTPIDRTAHGAGTFKVFGVDDEEGYLDKYSISESITDGTTLKLHYSLSPSEMLLPTDLLEREFLELKEAEGVSDIDDLNRILDQAVTLKNFLKSSSRIEAVSDFVVEHFRQNVEPLGYKAFLVGIDREVCAMYKAALDRRMPPEESVVVYSQSDPNEPQLIKQHRLTEEQEEDVRRAFRKPDQSPKILIVTEKLLTGFDAPILYCMYLDKPMRDHVLLQAIARVNRPYEGEDRDTKPSGLVLDFVGIFEKGLVKALAFDPDVVSGVIENLDILAKRFDELLTDDAQPYVAFYSGEIDDKKIEAMMDHFIDPGERDNFTRLFREIETLYEILSPSPDLAQFIDDYRVISRLYKDMTGVFAARGPEVKDLMKKTESLVRDYVDVTGLNGALPVYEINEETLELIRADAGSQNAKVINLARSLEKAVRQDEVTQPHLIPIADRADHVLELFENRQMGSKEALDTLEKAIEEYNQARRERERRGLDVQTFSAFWILRQSGLDDGLAEEVARDMAHALHTLGAVSEERRRESRADLYSLLIPHIDKRHATTIVEQLLRTAT